ncbi:Lar family restriction alleviation protein [Pseudomonas alkylphenolica]|uniref:Lar family restriction alleviation protein n=1 Tax=Pseudomonas alkylphenolica TaxID=237609 RepID=UPI00056F1AD7|nr:Lar family restriction alleviation protein [Pseudomonas alkylphenolica]
MSDELKPCPQCSSDNLEIDSSSSLSLSWVICNDCDFTLQKKVPEENIWRHWNKLKPAPKP